MQGPGRDETAHRVKMNIDMQVGAKGNKFNLLNYFLSYRNPKNSTQILRKVIVINIPEIIIDNLLKVKSNKRVHDLL